MAAKSQAQDVIDISGMDFRFDPLTGEAEAVSGNGQFGLTFDDYGNRFICTNRNPLIHVVLEDRYLKQNPPWPCRRWCTTWPRPATSRASSPSAGPGPRRTCTPAQFTAACGVEIYRGDALPKEFYGNAFTCDPTGNLVHREIMKPQGRDVRVARRPTRTASSSPRPTNGSGR